MSGQKSEEWWKFIMSQIKEQVKKKKAKEVEITIDMNGEIEWIVKEKESETNERP